MRAADTAKSRNDDSGAKGERARLQKALQGRTCTQPSKPVWRRIEIPEVDRRWVDEISVDVHQHRAGAESNQRNNKHDDEARDSDRQNDKKFLPPKPDQTADRREEDETGRGETKQW